MFDPSKTLQAARQMYSFARQGEEDFRAAGSRRISGLYTAVTSGRSVTFVLQKLRGSVGKERFDQWYAPFQDGLKSDPVARWFVELRNRIEKEGEHGTSGYTLTVESFNTSEVVAPPGATNMFIGDLLGRSGWDVTLPDGSTTQVFFQIPNSQLGMYIDDAPADRPVEELLAEWLDSLDQILSAAESEFG